MKAFKADAEKFQQIVGKEITAKGMLAVRKNSINNILVDKGQSITVTGIEVFLFRSYVEPVPMEEFMEMNYDWKHVKIIGYRISGSGDVKAFTIKTFSQFSKLFKIK